MSTAKSIAILAAACALLGLPAAAEPQTLSEVSVSGRVPTELRIDIASKAATAVRQEVRVAAGTVCRNAVTNDELEFYDVRWCSDKASARALRQYSRIVSGRTSLALAPSAIVLAAW